MRFSSDLTAVLIMPVFWSANIGVDYLSYKFTPQKESLRPKAFAISSERDKSHFKESTLDLKGLVDRIGDVEKVCSTLIGLLDFDSTSFEQTLTNIIIINLFSELGDEYKTLSVAERIAEFIHNQGAYQKLLKKPAINFFKSVSSDELLFQNIADSQKVADEIEKALPLLPDITQYIREIRRYPMLTPLGEFKFGVLGCLGDEEATKQLARSNTRLVVSIARKYTWCGLSLEALIAAGNLGLMKAVNSFKPRKGFKFGDHAYYLIWGSILDHIVESRIPIRIPPYQQRLIGKYKKECARRNLDPKDRDIKDSVVAEIAKALGVKVKKVRQMADMIFTISSLQQLRPDRDEEDREATREAEIGVEDKKIKESECIEILARIVMEVEDRLTRRWKPELIGRNIKIYRLRILSILTGKETRSLRQVGPESGISYERVRQLEKEAKEDLARVVITLDIDANYLRRVIAFTKEKWNPQELEKIIWRKIEELKVKNGEIKESECLEIFAKIVIEAEDALSERRGWSRIKKSKMKIFRLIVLPMLRGEVPMRRNKPMNLKGVDQACGVCVGTTGYLRGQLRLEIARAKKRLGVDEDYFKRVIESSKRRWTVKQLDKILWNRIAELREDRYISGRGLDAAAPAKDKIQKRDDKIQKGQNAFMAICRAA